jgi:hypothetical protein
MLGDHQKGGAYRLRRTIRQRREKRLSGTEGNTRDLLAGMAGATFVAAGPSADGVVAAAVALSA